MTWWNTSWLYSINNPIADGARPYQISLNVSNATGTNNATYIFCNGHCNVNFTDIRFTSDNTTELPYWIDNVTTGKVWVNVTTNGTVNMYYGNTAATSTSNGNTTFLKYWITFPGSITTPTFGVNTAIKFYINLNTHFERLGYGNPTTLPRITFQVDTSYNPDIRGLYESVEPVLNGASNINTGYKTYDLIRNGTTSLIWRINNIETISTSGFSTDSLPIRSYLGTTELDWLLVRNYSYPEPSWSTWGTEQSNVVSTIEKIFAIVI